MSLHSGLSVQRTLSKLGSTSPSPLLLTSGFRNPTFCRSEPPRSSWCTDNLRTFALQAWSHDVHGGVPVLDCQESIRGLVRPSPHLTLCVALTRCSPSCLAIFNAIQSAISDLEMLWLAGTFIIGNCASSHFVGVWAADNSTQ